MNFFKKIKHLLIPLFWSQVVQGANYSALPYSSYYFDFEIEKSLFVARFMIPNDWDNDSENLSQNLYALLTPGGVNVNTAEVSLRVSMKFCPDTTSVSDHHERLKKMYLESGWHLDESHSNLKTYDNRAVSAFIGLDRESGYIRYDEVVVLEENPQLLILFGFQVSSLNPIVLKQYLPTLPALIQSIKISKPDQDKKDKESYMLDMIKKLGPPKQ